MSVFFRSFKAFNEQFGEEEDVRNERLMFLRVKRQKQQREDLAGGRYEMSADTWLPPVRPGSMT